MWAAPGWGSRCLEWSPSLPRLRSCACAGTGPVLLSARGRTRSRGLVGAGGSGRAALLTTQQALPGGAGRVTRSGVECWEARTCLGMWRNCCPERCWPSTGVVPGEPGGRQLVGPTSCPGPFLIPKPPPRAGPTGPDRHPIDPLPFFAPGCVHCSGGCRRVWRTVTRLVSTGCVLGGSGHEPRAVSYSCHAAVDWVSHSRCNLTGAWRAYRAGLYISRGGEEGNEWRDYFY